MIIDLIAIKKFPYAFDLSIAPSDIDFEEENFSLESPARVKGELTKGIVQTDIGGEITAAIEIGCTRCLGKIDKNLEIPFKVSFVTEEFYTKEKEAELRAEDLDAALFEGGEIDLTELVREQILLNAPTQIFCRDECRGLCEKCGANRNLIDCSCAENEIDPRWAALKNLK